MWVLIFIFAFIVSMFPSPPQHPPQRWYDIEVTIYVCYGFEREPSSERWEICNFAGSSENPINFVQWATLGEGWRGERVQVAGIGKAEPKVRYNV